MITIIALAYVACVVVAFKYVKIKVNPISVAAATVIGVLLLLGIVIAWKLGAPMTDQLTVRRMVVPLLADQDSKELISKIHVQPDQPVKKGDALWEVESAPNQFAADGLTAQVAVAEHTVQQLEASVDVAAAAADAALASQAYAKAKLDTARRVQEINPAGVSTLKAEVAAQDYAAAQAGVREAQANRQEADFALTAARSSVDAVKAQLHTAELNLSRNVTRAPADGFVANMQITEGTMTTTVMSSAQGSFVDTSDTIVSLVLPQNLVSNVAPGDVAEIAFKSLPGELVTGKVHSIAEYTGEGQLVAGRSLPVAATIRSRGRLVVRVHLDDDAIASELPIGGAGTATIYTKAFGAFHLISKVTIRMKMWMNYLPI